MPTTDETIAQIRAIYFHAKPATVESDLARAIALLKSIPGEEDRQRADVYMEGLNEMRREWKGERADEE